MFQFRRFPSCTYGFSTGYQSMNSGEFPHSEISGSMDVCSSPKLIAAYHVFRRLPVPRHSPCALCSLTVVSLSQNISLFQILHLPTRFYRLVKLYCLQLYHGFNILLLISCFAVLYSVFKVLFRRGFRLDDVKPRCSSLLL